MKTAEDWMMEFGKTQSVDLVIEGVTYSAGDTVTILSAHDIRKIQCDALTKAAEIAEQSIIIKTEPTSESICSNLTAAGIKQRIESFRDSLNKGEK